MNLGTIGKIAAHTLLVILTGGLWLIALLVWYVLSH